MSCRSPLGPSQPDAIGWTPLHWACSKGHTKEVKALLKHNADPNVATEVDGWTAAHDAARKGNHEALSAIHLAGGNIEKPSSSGTRPLHYAVQYGRTACVDAMLKPPFKCDVDAPNTTGWSPLHFAARYGRKDICALLLKEGACPTTVDKLGRSCEALANEVREAINQGKATLMKLDEHVKADTLQEMMEVLKEAADRQADEALKTAKLAMENYKSSAAAGDLHGAREHITVAQEEFIKARETEQAKQCHQIIQQITKEMEGTK